MQLYRGVIQNRTFMTFFSRWHYLKYEIKGKKKQDDLFFVRIFFLLIFCRDLTDEPFSSLSVVLNCEDWI